MSPSHGAKYASIPLAIPCTILPWYAGSDIILSSDGFDIYPISRIVTGTLHQLIPLIVSVSQIPPFLHPQAAVKCDRICSESLLLWL